MLNYSYISAMVRIILLVFIVILLCFLFPEWNYIGVLIGGGLWLFFCLYNFTRMSTFFFAMLLIIMPYTFSILSEFIFELIPSFSPEMLMDTFLTGGVIRLVFYNLIFFLTAYVAFVHVERKKPLGYMSSNEMYFGSGLFLIVTLLMVVSYYLYGVPVFNQMTRFEFWQGEAGENPLLIFGKSQMPLCVLFCSLLYIKHPRISMMGITTIMLILVLGGEKFTELLHALILFFCVYFFQKEIEFSKKIYLKILMGSILFVSITGGLVYYHYTDLINNISIPVTDLLLMRFTEQGQVWWYIDAQMNLAGNTNHIEDFLYEIKGFFQTRQDNFDVMHLGIYKMMEVMRGQEYVVNRIISGSRFTEGYPAVGLYYFGYIGLVLSQIFFGGLYGVWAGKFYIAVRTSDLLSCFLYYKIWTGLNQAAVMGNFYELFKPMMLLYIFVLYVAFWWKKRFRKNIET